MISSAPQKGFLAAHWDWIVAIVAILALGASAAFAVIAFGEDPGQRADETRAELASIKRSELGVSRVEQGPFTAAFKELNDPSRLAEPAETLGSFLASERRVFCEQGDDAEHKSCGQPIPAGLKVCPICQTKQPEEKKVELDTDGDGIPDSWELAHAMNPNDASDVDADADGDGFTNMEEFLAGTDPQDASSHPDYLDSLRIAGPLKKTTLPFYFEKASQIPGGWRFFFKDPSKKNSYGQKGLQYSVVAGEAIGDTGYTVKAYHKKTEKRAIKGGKGLVKEVDVSQAEIVRKADGRAVRLSMDERNKAIDVQAMLVYERGETKEFAVVKGDEIALNSEKFKVIEIKSLPNDGASVTLKNVESGKLRTISTLEQQ